jgi:hypothetical protein
MLEIALMQWKVGLIHKELWSKGARRGTVLVESNGDSAQALLLDDVGGARRYFQLDPEKVDEVIGAAAAAWIARGHGGSFAVIVNSDLGMVSRGGVTPPNPPPPPGPPGHEVLRTAAIAAHFQLLGVAETAQHQLSMGRFQRERDRGGQG